MIPADYFTIHMGVSSSCERSRRHAVHFCTEMNANTSFQFEYYNLYRCRRAVDFGHGAQRCRRTDLHASTACSVR